MKNLYFLLFLFLLACNNKQSRNVQRGIVKKEIEQSDANLKSVIAQIELNKKYPKKEFLLQDIADIEYIPLDTHEDILLAGGALSRVYVSDDTIITYNKEDGTVFIFNRLGKILNFFKCRGRGAGEYHETGELVTDFARKEIFIYDYLAMYRILVYGFDGKYKRTLPLPKVWINLFFNYDVDHLLIYDDKGLGEAGDIVNKKPYGLISKKDGKYSPIELSIENRVLSGIKTEKIIHGKPTMVRLFISCYPVLKNGKQLFVSDWSCDTMYRVNGLHLEPFMVKSPSTQNLKPWIWTEVVLKTDRYTFMELIIEKQLLENLENGVEKIETQQLVYDHTTNEIYTFHFENADYPEEKIHLDAQACELPENYARGYFTASGLLKALKAGRLKGKLKKIASQLNEEDNPVLMLVKFKN